MSSLQFSNPSGCSGHEHYRSQAEMSRERIVRLRQLARRYGDTYAAYLATEGGREYFWPTRLEGVVAFRRVGRYVNVADGLLAAPSNRERLLTEFLRFTDQHGWVVTFMNVPRNEINLFRRQGCQVTKCGEEALVDLDRATWHGKDSAWLRRQENYCQRHGVKVFEVIPDLADPYYRDEVAPQLEKISRDHVDSTLHQREMQFYVSSFSADDLDGRRLFVAQEGEHISGFIVCNPGLDGDFWAVEVYRRRRDAVRGVIPCIIMHTMREMKVEGVRYFSLSLSPFLRCTAVRGDSRMYRYIVNFWWRRMNSIYDVQGIYHFKSRFRPDYREMFLAAKPGVSVRSLLVIAFIWKLFHFSPLRWLHQIWQDRRNSKQHTLANPDRRSKRVIRELRPRPVGGTVTAADLPVSTDFQQEHAEIQTLEDVSV